MDSELVSASRESKISMVEATGMKDSRPTVKLRGGYTCCVPGCYSNSKQEKHLSFYMIPKDKILQTKWLNAIKRKDFTPGKHHRMCSLHFRMERKWEQLVSPSCFL